MKLARNKKQVMGVTYHGYDYIQCSQREDLVDHDGKCYCEAHVWLRQQIALTNELCDRAGLD